MLIAGTKPGDRWYRERLLLSIDIFTVGSDWEGYFDYLGKWCRVIYLDRTEGISSAELRTESCNIRLGIIADNKYAEKIIRESNYVNGLTISGAYVPPPCNLTLSNGPGSSIPSFESLSDLLKCSDAASVVVKPHLHYQIIRAALEAGLHRVSIPANHDKRPHAPKNIDFEREPSFSIGKDR